MNEAIYGLPPKPIQPPPEKPDPTASVDGILQMIDRLRSHVAYGRVDGGVALLEAQSLRMLVEIVSAPLEWTIERKEDEARQTNLLSQAKRRCRQIEGEWGNYNANRGPKDVANLNNFMASAIVLMNARKDGNHRDAVKIEEAFDYLLRNKITEREVSGVAAIIEELHRARAAAQPIHGTPTGGLE